MKLESLKALGKAFVQEWQLMPWVWAAASAARGTCASFPLRYHSCQCRGHSSACSC